MLDWGIDTVLRLQTLLGPGWKGFMLLFSKGLGDAPGYILLILLFYYIIDRSMGLRLLILLGFSDGLNNLLKNSIAAGRPFQADSPITMMVHEDGYGLPSGHAQLSGTVYGRLLSEPLKGWIKAIILTVLLGIGLSRMYLGLHTPEQVAAGWLFALLVLLLSGPVENFIIPRIMGWSFLKTFLVITVGALLFSLLTIWITFMRDIPHDYLERFELMDHALAGAGLTAGAILGGWKLKKGKGWELPVKFGKRLLTFFLSLSIAVLLVLVLEDILLRSLHSLPALCSALFLSRFFLGLSSTFLLPLLYHSIGLS